jgi:hypothetical protein
MVEADWVPSGCRASRSGIEFSLLFIVCLEVFPEFGCSKPSLKLVEQIDDQHGGKTFHWARHTRCENKKAKQTLWMKQAIHGYGICSQPTWPGWNIYHVKEIESQVLWQWHEANSARWNLEVRCDPFDFL